MKDVIKGFENAGWTVYWEENLPKYLTLTRNENGRNHAINVAPSIVEDKFEITSYEEGTGAAIAIDYDTIVQILVWSILTFPNMYLVEMKEDF